MTTASPDAPATPATAAPAARIFRIEVAPLPSELEAIAEMFAPAIGAQQVEVRTGFRYDIAGLSADVTQESLARFAQAALANPVIQDIHLSPFLPERFPQGSAYTFRLTHVPMREL